MFIDQVNIALFAGKGGNGCLSFRREKSVPRGGPNGGRGGDGGSVYLVADSSTKSLSYFRFHPIIRAERGRNGEGSNRTGRNGGELRLNVPVGTVVKLKDQDQILMDFLQPGREFLAVKGGKGGRGNASFATSVHQAPRMFEEGEPGGEIELTLELKLIADVGVIGFPNVGKSTLISKLSAANPVIADYPFTTLSPNLGVVDVSDFNSFVIADIPGLISGAHLGHGLGIRFLRHIERTKVLAHMIDISPYTQRDPVEDYAVVMGELEAFNPDLIKKPQILVANKIDSAGTDQSRIEAVRKLAELKGHSFHAISAVKAEGLKSLVNTLAEELRKLNDGG